MRIHVVGTSGSGKTTVARRFAAARGIPHVELDALHWEPGWKEAQLDVFRARVAEALSPDAWVVDGNYTKVRDLVHARIDTLVWLDFPFALVMLRVATRTLRRVVSREPLRSGNRESFRQSFLSRESVILWALQTYARNRRRYSALLASPACAHLRRVRLRGPAEVEAWLRGAL